MSDFDKIRARAAERKGGEDVLSSLLGTAPDNSAMADIPDDRILSIMTKRVFCAGFVWRVIEQKWPGFEDAFLDFEPKRLLFQPDDFWHDLASDSRIVKNPQKIRSVRDNAAFVDRVSSEHGGFGKFLAEWPPDDQLGLLAYLGKHGSRLGGNTGQYFLRWIGWDAYIMSADMLGALRDCRPRGGRGHFEEGQAGDPGANESLARADRARLHAPVAPAVAFVGHQPQPRGAPAIYGRLMAQCFRIAGRYRPR